MVPFHYLASSDAQIRTEDLRDMSPASYRAALRRDKLLLIAAYLDSGCGYK